MTGTLLLLLLLTIGYLITTMSKGGIFKRLANLLSSTPTPAPTRMAEPAITPLNVDYDDERIPKASKGKVADILKSLADVEQAMQREHVSGFSQTDVLQMREQHLPKLIKSYIDIPPDHRAEIFRKMGKSASFILNESLDQMQSRIDEILRNLAQHDIDAFTNNTMFIQKRYTNSNPFD